MLIDQVADDELLLKCFYDVEPKPQGGKKYAREYRQIELDPVRAVQDVAARLRDGVFQFEPPRLVVLGETRPLLLLGPLDRAVELAILRTMKPHVRDLLARPNTYGRESGIGEDKRSLKTLSDALVQRRKNCSHIYETDIKKFFPSIQNGYLSQQIASLLPDASLTGLLQMVVHRQPRDMERLPPDLSCYFDEIDRGVAQGSCLSPLLASIYLLEFDRKMETLGIPYIRYVDDLILFCTAEERAIQMEGFLAEELGRIGLTIHRTDREGDSKANIVRGDQPLTFVGREFLPNGDVFPSDKAIKRFESRVTEIAREAPNLMVLLTRLANFVQGWDSAYEGCKKPKGLRKRLDRHQLDTIRGWAKERGVLARSYHDYPRRRQAADLGLVLLAQRQLGEEEVVILDDSSWYDSTFEDPEPIN